MLKNHWFLRIRTARAGRNFENSYRCFSRTYGAIRMILCCAVLKFLRNPMVFEDFGVRARRKNKCVPHGIIWQGWWPWQVRNRCWRSSKHVKKLLAKARLTEMFTKCWVPYKSARARGMKVWHFLFEKPLVFWCFYVKIATKTKVLEGFRLARANVHFTLFFARDSWSLVMLEQEMSTLASFLQGKIDRNNTTGSGVPRFAWDFLTKMMKMRLRPRRGGGAMHQGPQQ